MRLDRDNEEYLNECLRETREKFPKYVDMFLTFFLILFIGLIVYLGVFFYVMAATSIIC